MDEAKSGGWDPSIARKHYPDIRNFREYLQERLEAPQKPFFHVYMLREEIVFCDYEEGWVRGLLGSMRGTTHVPYRCNTPEMVSRCLPRSVPRMEGFANPRLNRTSSG